MVVASTYLIECIRAVHGAAGAALPVRLAQRHQLRLAGKCPAKVIVAGALHHRRAIDLVGLPVEQPIRVVVLLGRQT